MTSEVQKDTFANDAWLNDAMKKAAAIAEQQGRTTEDVLHSALRLGLEGIQLGEDVVAVIGLGRQVAARTESWADALGLSPEAYVERRLMNS